MPFGQLPLYALKRESGVFDPATLSLTGWWRASYSGSPWVGSTSTGTSGSRDLTEATNPPTTGSAVNGYTSVDFDGVNDLLTNATQLGTLLPTASYFWWVVFNVDTITGTSNLASAYGNEGLFSDSFGYIGAAVAEPGAPGAYVAQAWQYDVGGKGGEHPITLSSWNLLCCRYDGTTMHSKLNSGSIVTQASGTYDLSTGTLKAGVRYDGSRFFDGKILDIGMMPSAGSDALFDDIKSYINSRYALAL